MPAGKPDLHQTRAALKFKTPAAFADDN